MFDPVRVYATAIYGGCVVFALIFALLVSNLYSLCSVMALFLLLVNYLVEWRTVEA
jgi:hypothetical protein